MKKKLLFLNALLILNTLSLVSCANEKFYNVNFEDTSIKIIGDNKVKANEDYIFKLDYSNDHTNNKIIVYANGKEVSLINGSYLISDVQSDLNITFEIIKKDSYSIDIINNDDLFEWFTPIKSNIVDPGKSYSFTIKFWGGYDLSDIKFFANDIEVLPENFLGAYQTNTNYNFYFGNINQDIDFRVEGGQFITWFTYDLGQEIKYFQQGIQADLEIDTTKIGYKFLGWSLNKNDISNLISLPYKNPTNNKEVTLYAVYKLDNSNLDLPFISINITDGSTLSKETYSQGSINLVTNDNISNQDCSIKLRGNSTSTYFKKPYKLKFNDPVSFFGSEANKEWVLLADYLDPSLIRNYTALTLANYAKHLDFNHTLKHVELELNGVYQGVYLLTDQIEAKKESRIPIKVDNIDSNDVPFLLERDKDGEGIYGVNYFTVGITNYIIKYPSNPTKEQFDYIYNYINTLYEYIKVKDIEKVSKYLDMDSFYEYVLINELMVNIDSNWKSGYLYRPQGGILTFGPVWDFDWCFSSWTSNPAVDKEFLLIDKFFLLRRDTKDFSFDWMIYLIQNKDIYMEVINAWNGLKEAYNMTLRDIKEYYSYIKDAGYRNYQKWYEYYYQLGGSANYIPIENLFVDQYNYVLYSLTSRYQYLDELFQDKNHYTFINEEFQ